MIFRQFVSVALLVVISNLALAQPDEAMVEKFREFDKDKNGKLTPEEFPRENLFRRLDKNNDGQIELSELPDSLRAKTNRSNKNVKQDLSYGVHKANRLDWHSPEKPNQPGPIMVYVHGGGWKKGDKKNVGEKAKYFNQNGWHFVSVEYRMLPDGKHPNNVDDIVKAIQWIHNNASKLKADPDNLFIMGHSAGAHLVSLAATRGAKNLVCQSDHAKSDTPMVKGVISLDTKAYDVNSLVEQKQGFYDSVFGNESSVQKDASPFHHIAKEKGIPPFLICFSKGLGFRKDQDRAARAREFAQRLQQSGIEAQIVDASDRSHGQINQWFGRKDDAKVTGAAMKFLKKHVVKAKQKPDSSAQIR